MKIAFACLLIGTDGSDSDWEAYKKQFGKVYNGDENEVYRRGIFEENLVLYADLNSQEPLAHYGPTIFTDMRTDEYINGYSPSTETLPELEIGAVTVATSRDWTGKYTSPIKDQGSCGSCWAESAISQIESDAMREHGWTGILSTQELVDCTSDGQGSYRNGCGGGDPIPGYKVIEALGGVASGYDYSYMGRGKPCDINSYQKLVTVESYMAVGTKDEDKMKAYVSSTGPLSVCVDANSWGGYNSGVKTSCGRSIDHCVQLVGFGKQGSTEYWKVRNSWGGGWGENGNIRLAIGHDLCKISNGPTATSTSIVGSPAPAPSTCTDQSGWTSTDGDPCSIYQLNTYCNADGTTGDGWNTCEWGDIDNYAGDGGSVFDACCACGGGSTGAASSARSSVKTNVTSEGQCSDHPKNWQSSEGDSCCAYPWNSYCTSDGKAGIGWDSSWGSIEDYADSNGLSAFDACCGCGGGRRSVVV